MQERWNDKIKVVIVGGVAGGATAAARIRRLDEQAEIVVKHCESLSAHGKAKRMRFSSNILSREWWRMKCGDIIHIPGCICRFALGFCKNKKKRSETLYQSFRPFMANPVDYDTKDGCTLSGAGMGAVHPH